MNIQSHVTPFPRAESPVRVPDYTAQAIKTAALLAADFTADRVLAENLSPEARRARLQQVSDRLAAAWAFLTTEQDALMQALTEADRD